MKKGVGVGEGTHESIKEKIQTFTWEWEWGRISSKKCVSEGEVWHECDVHTLKWDMGR
jgi:hypothetical protein